MASSPSARWYDLFANVYDAWLERLYAPWREQAFTDLSVDEGHVIVDVCCGTGQNFPWLAKACPQAPIVGVDRSAGMLRRAQVRVDRDELAGVQLVEHDVLELGPQVVHDAVGSDAPVGLVVIALGLTVLPDWERAFAQAFDLLAPGGELLIFDVHASRRSFQTWAVELTAQADLNREVFAPLEAASADYRRTIFDAPPSTFGGDLFVARGRRPT